MAVDDDGVRINVQVFSDTTCPWCYLGLKSLERAVETFKKEKPGVEVAIVWTPFYLFPDAKPSVCNKKELYAHKFGSRAPAFFAKVEQTAEDFGIPLTWDGKTGGTRDSHKLVLLAQQRSFAAAAPYPSSPPPEEEEEEEDRSKVDDRDLHLRVLDRLFSGAFTRGRDVSDRAYLAEVAVETGLFDSAEEALRWLDAGEAGAAADAADMRAREIRIGAVPSYLIQGRYQVGGYQAPEVFLGLFEKISGGARGSADAMEE